MGSSLIPDRFPRTGLEPTTLGLAGRWSRLINYLAFSGGAKLVKIGGCQGSCRLSLITLLHYKGPLRATFCVPG